MLSPDHVEARRQKGRLFLVALGPRKERAVALARELLQATQSVVGQSREALEDAWDAITVEPRDRKLKDGLQKLIEDQLAFDVETPLDPVELRQRVFSRAAKARQEGRFDREALLAEAAAELEIEPGALEQALFADLKSAHVVRPKHPSALADSSAEALVQGYDLAQRQAVLLRATEVVVELRDADRAALRSLFRKLKFLRLLFTAQTLAGGLVQLKIDGPFSLFESVTKYGLSLALALPWIEAAGEHKILADVRWGKERLPLRFSIEGPRTAPQGAAPTMPEELATLMRRLRERDDPDWNVAEASAVLEAKGIGVILPDLELTHRSGARVYLELLGYWSREALWRRIEMVDKGLLREKVVFCASERLRVSEEALDSEHAALLVYKGSISVSALLRKLELLLAAQG